MCDFRKPYFKETDEPVPYGCGFYLNYGPSYNPRFKDLEGPLQPKHFYSAITTGSFSEYFDGNRFWNPNEDCPEIYWKYERHTH